MPHRSAGLGLGLLLVIAGCGPMKDGPLGRVGGDKKDRDLPPPDATQLVRQLGKIVGGGGGGSAEVALAGGKDPSQIEAALAEAQRLLSA